MTSPPINTHNLVCDFGKHRGELWTRIPVSYLIWLSGTPPMDGTPAQREISDGRKRIAEAELARRGTTLPEIEISGHAIDSASLRVRKVWHETALSDQEGLHSWLCRMALEAKMSGCRDPKQEDKIHYQGVAFVFEQEGKFPIVKTVMPSNMEIK